MPPSNRKSIIVTGGASGIGLAITRHFASEGHQIAIFDVSVVTGPRVAAEVAKEYPDASISFKECDVSSWKEQATAFREVYDEYGHIDVVMANAGISERGSSSLIILAEDLPSEPDLTTINVNLVGVIYSVKLAIHYMNKNAGNTENSCRGSIICTASNAGIYPFPVAPLYASTKAGVISLVRSLARPLLKAQIQINALAPAVLETNIAPDKALFKSMIITPMSTLTRAVSQFLSDSSLTGQVIEVHGQNVTISPPQAYVDADSEKNIETFWSLGYA